MIGSKERRKERIGMMNESGKGYISVQLEELLHVFSSHD
jgi:hypothetical protein